MHGCPSMTTLQWRNGRDGVSHHQPHDCLLNRLFRCRSKKTSKLCVTGLCAGIHREPVNSPHKWPVTRKVFPFDGVIMKCLPNHKVGIIATFVFQCKWKRIIQSFWFGVGWLFLYCFYLPLTSGTYHGDWYVANSHARAFWKVLK